MVVNNRRALLAIGSLVIAFLVLRIYLHWSPNTNFQVGASNVHHLFTGLILVMFGGLPLAILQGNSRTLDLATVGFGTGLGMALDEWVYLITTDGSDASYLLPISFWGGVLMIALACGYGIVLVLYGKRCQKPDT